MTDEVWKYFWARYRKCDFRVVPYHWPDFKNKADVDKWIQFMEKLSDFEDEPEEEETPPENGCNVCPSGGVIFIDPPRRLDAEMVRSIKEMAESYLRKYGKKAHTTDEEERQHEDTEPDA